MIKVIKFSSLWCQPCKQLSPIFEQVKSQVSDVSFVDIDVDSNKEITSKYSVSSIPTVVIEKDGVVVDRFTGIKPQNQIVNLINQYK
jgi:thioredoxin 1